MTGPASREHARVHQRVHAMMTAAMRADPAELDVLAAGAGEARLDPYTREFVGASRRLMLACTAGLTCVLAAHRPGGAPDGRPICRGCGTRECRTLHGIADVLSAYAVRPAAIDRAEAWRRADAHFAAAGRPTPLSVDEFEEGYIIRAVPSVDGAAPLVIDRLSGELTRWPDFPRDVLVAHYRRYVEG